MLTDAPVIIDHLCADCRAHFTRCAVPARRDRRAHVVKAPTLVRGLDYYRRTTFECCTTGSAPSPPSAAVVATTGLMVDRRPSASGVGLALGIDRILLASTPSRPSRPVGALARPLRRLRRTRSARREDEAVVIADALRPGGSTSTSLRRPRAQGLDEGRGPLRRAFAIVIGDRDLGRGVVQVKDRGQREQRRSVKTCRVTRPELVRIIRDRNAGTLRAEHVGRPSPSPGGSRIAGTTGRHFLDLRDASGFVQWWCARSWRLAGCAPSTASGDRRGVRPARGDANPNLPTGASR